jgi:hypothetical protein
VDHGPFLFDNNILLSQTSVGIQSQGGAFVHNLFAGVIHLSPADKRMTPFHRSHATDVAGFHDNPHGDMRFYNNVFIRRGDLSAYDTAPMPGWMEGNVFVQGAKACCQEKQAIVETSFDPGLGLIADTSGFLLNCKLDKSWRDGQARRVMTTRTLGRAAIPKARFEQSDGKEIRIDRDYFGAKRLSANPFPGPFEVTESANCALIVWPATNRQQNLLKESQ